MNPFHLHIPYGIIIIVLCGIIFLQREFGGHHTINNNDNRVYKYDSSQKEIPVKYINQPAQLIPYSVPVNIDSQAIAEDYYKKRIYNQTVGDSLMSAEIYASVFKNRLDSLGFKYKIYKPTAIITEVKPEKFKLFVGGELGASKTGLTTFAPAIYVTTKKDHLYTANYNLFNGSVNVGIAWKIKFKK